MILTSINGSVLSEQVDSYNNSPNEIPILRFPI